ncbi:hypothetical protein ABI36_0228270 [Pseudomonas aeruginosa]|nr:hypothetical protein AN450_15920 [Pseudomonas aeruginosa]OHW55547.1 hypothetical protein ABI36_0228270 [Pseudomonas aeruginosa]
MISSWGRRLSLQIMALAFRMMLKIWCAHSSLVRLQEWGLVSITLIWLWGLVVACSPSLIRKKLNCQQILMVL